MPKETIHAEVFDVELTWGRDRDIQIATVVKPTTAARGNYVMPDGSIEKYEIPASLGTLIDGWPTEERYTSTGLYATLPNRQAVNDLIRILRRARDQAYGRDE